MQVTPDESRMHAVRWWRRALVATRRALLSHHSGVLALYLLLSWGVRFSFGTDLSDASYAGSMNEDAGQFIWHFLHLKRAIFDGQELFFTDRVFYPVGLQMVRQDWAPTAGLIALPFQFLGPLGAVNMQVLLLFAMCGYTTYLLAHHLCRDRLLAFMAGVIFAFCEFRMDKSMGHINQANQQFIPLYLLFMLLYFQSGRWRHAVGAAVSFYLATFCTYYQLVFIIVLTALYVMFISGRPLVLDWRRPRRWPGLLRPVALRVAGFVLLTGLASLPLLAPVILNAWEGFVQAAKSLTLYMPEYSADLLSYVISNLYTLPEQRLFSGEGGTAFLGYSPLVLLIFAVITLRWRTGAGLWVFMALCLFVISLGSTLVVAGKPVCELPVFRLLQAIPVVKGAKVAARFSSLVVLCVALAGAITLAQLERSWLSQWRPSTRLMVRLSVVLMVCAELLIPPARYMRTALPAPYEVPAAYRAMEVLDDDAAVLQYPLTWDAFSGNIGPHHFPRQLFAYQTLHGKPIFSGIGNMVPATTLRYLQRTPLVGDLVKLGQGHPLAAGVPEHVRLTSAGYVAAELNLKLIVVYKRMIIPGGDLFRERYRAAVKYLDQTLTLRLITQDEQLLMYAVEAPFDAAQPRRITFTHPRSLVHLGGGWRRIKRDNDWVAETTLEVSEPKELFFRLQRDGPTLLTLIQRCSLPPCRVTLRLNNRHLTTLSLDQRWAPVEVRLPAAQVKVGLNRLVLEQAGDVLGRETLQVGRTGTRTRARLRVVSAGVNVGDRASVKLNGIEVVPNTRGYNVAVVDAGSGDLVKAAAFDLISSPDGSQARLLARFIAEVPDEMVVCVAVRDDGSMGVTPAVITALRSIGAAVSPQDHLRRSYALVGVKGAKPGQALEQVATRPVVLELGRVVQLRSLGLRRK